MINVYSEFDTLKIVLVHSAENVVDCSMDRWKQFLTPEEFTKHLETGPVDRNIFIEQIKSMHLFLEKKGVKLIYAKTIKNAVCQAFTRDPGFVIGNTFFIGSMRDHFRVDEANGFSELQKSFPQVQDLRNEGCQIEGGDVMIINKETVFIGTGEISNQQGFDLVYFHLKNKGFKNIVRIKHEALHLDCCLSPLPNGKAFFAERLLPIESREILKNYFSEFIPLDRDEESINLAANFFWISPSEVMSNSNTPKTNIILKDFGYKVNVFDFSHVTRMWGSIRCTICPLLRDSNVN